MVTRVSKLRLSYGRNIKSPYGKKLRPTSSLVREAVMNIVAPKIRQSRWLDLYSGSGALGCEALHRGACKVVAVEKDKNTADFPLVLFHGK